MTQRVRVTSNEVFSIVSGAQQPAGSGKGEGKPGRPPVLPTLDDHEPWDKGVPRRLVREIGKNAVRSAKAEAKSRGMGDLPGHLLVAIDDFLKSKVNWKRLLKSWVGSQIRISWKRTRKRPSRRFQFDFPGRKPVRSARVWVAVDNSGSVSQHELRQFFGELVDLLDVVKVVIVVWDTDIRQVFEVKNRRHLMEIAKGIGGGGGTLVSNVFHALTHKGEAIEGIQGSRHLRQNPEGIIVLTDGGIGDYPPESIARGIPTLWAITEEGFLGYPNFGRSIHIDIDPEQP